MSNNIPSGSLSRIPYLINSLRKLCLCHHIYLKEIILYLLHNQEVITQWPFKSKSWEHTSSPGAESQAPAWKESIFMARKNMQFDFLRKSWSKQRLEWSFSKRDLLTDTLHDKVLTCWMGDYRLHSWSVTNCPFCKSLLQNCSLQIEPCPTDKQKERECYLLALPQGQILNSPNPNSLEETSICRPKLLWLSGCQVLSLGNFWHNNPLFGKTGANMFPKIACQQEQKHASDLPEGLPGHKPRLLRCVRDSSSCIFNGPCSLFTRRCRLLLPTSFAWSCSSTHPVMHSWKRALVILTYKKK